MKFLRAICCLVIGLFVFPVASRAQSPFTRAADIRSLSHSEAAQGPAVKVRGVVTLLWRQGRQGWAVQDESAGIWVSARAAFDRGIYRGDTAELDRLQVGAVVEIEGVADPGGFSPIVVPVQVRIVGTQALPPAAELPMEALVSGGFDGQRAAARGIVIAQENSETGWLLRLDSPQGGFLAEVTGSTEFTAEPLVGAEVRIEGIVGTTFNSRGEFVAARMMAPASAVRILHPAPPDPFSVPKVPLSELAHFSPAGRSLQRQKVEGTVTYCAPGSHFYLQDGVMAVRVGTSATEVLQPGDRVEASGFLDYSRRVVGLASAAVRKLGTAPLPDPPMVTLEVLQRVFASMTSSMRPVSCDYDGLLVRTTGHLLDIHRDPSGAFQLVLDADGQITRATVPPSLKPDDSERKSLDHLRPGSLIGITGVAELEYARAPVRSREAAMPVGMNLQLRTPADVTVLKAASWWTAGRLAGAFLIALAVMALAFLWIAQLRRTVRWQAGRIEEALRAHRDFELEMRGAREERFRLAADIHDGFQQHLTGASYRLEAALMRLGQLPAGVQEQFAAARAALERTRTGLRECLIGLREVEEGPAEFPALLRQATERMEHWPRGAVEIVTKGDPFPISRHVMGSLLLLVQEAVSNAFRHGAATHVQVCVQYLPETLELCVEDDGSGFEPARAEDATAGHFGLESMRHRLRWLGGHTEIQSEPGKGTRIVARLSRKKAEADSSQMAEEETS